MRLFLSNSMALALVIANLVACGAGGQIGPTFAIKPNPALLQNRPPSWMAPAARRADLLYASDGGYNAVYVFNYRTAKLVGILTNLAGDAMSVCTDRAGDVFVTELSLFGDSHVAEYAHGGTEPIATLNVPGSPDGCSVDAHTGNLAVVIYSSGSSSTSSVAIYPGARGTPTIYSDPDIPYMTKCAYDDMGNLFISGANGQKFVLGELASGSNALQIISIKVKINGAFGQPIAWDGRRVVVGDFQGYSSQYVAYRIRARGGAGRVAGQSGFSLSRGDFSGDSAFWIQGDTIVFPEQNYRDGNRKSQLSFWHYPVGGSRLKFTRKFGTPYVAGVAVSLAPRR